MAVNNLTRSAQGSPRLQPWGGCQLIRSQVVGAGHHEHWVHVACPNPLLGAFIKRPIKRAAEGG